MASKSNGDDAGSPTPKRTRLGNADDVNDQQEKMIQALDAIKKNPASVLALSKSLSCDICKSLLRAPIHYCGNIDCEVINHHKVCSICFGELSEKQKNCPAEGCGEKLMPNNSVTEVVRAMKLPVPCKNRNNGCTKEGNEEEVEGHEHECEFRFVDSNTQAGVKMFKDLLSMIGKSVKKNDGKWKMHLSTLAWRDSIGPDGHIFRVILNANDDTYVKAYAYVIGGKNVANRYRVEMRLTSNDKEFTLTHHGPVFPVDVKDPGDSEKSYWIAKKRFAIFNKGFDKFGDHNKDKNGEVIIPMTVKIIKKELNIPKMD